MSNNFCRVYCGRARDLRSAAEESVYDFLDSLKISYLRADHEAVATIGDCKAVETALGCPICKNLVLTDRTGSVFCLYLLPGDKRFDSSLVSHALGTSRLSFASRGDMLSLLGVTPGCASVMGLIFDKERRVILAADRELCSHEFFACHPCASTSTVKLYFKDVFERFVPATGHGCVFIG